MLKSVSIKNFKSIKDSWEIKFSDNIFILAGQNESGKSSILEALSAYENEEMERDTLNFEEDANSNLKQEISCTYTVQDWDLVFIDELIDDLWTEFKIEEDFIDKEKLKKIKEYKITKIFDYETNLISVELNETVLGILKSAIKSKEHIEINEEGKEEKTMVPYIKIEWKEKEIASVFFGVSPKMTLFDESDILPDKILISDLINKNTGAKGYSAVKNIEKLMSKDFISLSNLSRGQKKSKVNKEVEMLSVTFQKDWNQKIYGNNKVEITFDVWDDNINGAAVPTVFFYIQTHKDIPLEPRKRSKWMIWFLSTRLELKAREGERMLIILYDEPGLSLHIKAHKDILGVFNSLAKRGHQVIFSTHSPSLIDTISLHNIGLVINTEDNWTIVEWLTTSKINTENKEDALQPIAEAMGLEPLKDFTVLWKKNVLLEGLSDFWYFQGMIKILKKDVDYKFIPSIGIKGSKINNLISFCIWYGLERVLVMDNWENPQATKKEIQEILFENNEEETNKKIKLIDWSDIENLFSSKDLNLIDQTIKADNPKAPIKIIWEKRKILFANLFLQKVKSWEITKAKIDATTIKKFEEIFGWIESNFSK